MIHHPIFLFSLFFHFENDLYVSPYPPKSVEWLQCLVSSILPKSLLGFEDTSGGGIEELLQERMLIFILEVAHDLVTGAMRN